MEGRFEHMEGRFEANATEAFFFAFGRDLEQQLAGASWLAPERAPYALVEHSFPALTA